MHLIPNIIYQFAVAPRRRHPDPDPEAPESNDDNLMENEQESVPVPDTSDPGAEPDEDNDQLDLELEQEQEDDSEDHPSSRRSLSDRTASISLTPTSSISTRFSAFWLKVRHALNPRTSEDLASYAPHYRHLPIISGLIIPFAILLEVPGLTEDWYIRTEMNKTVDRRRNTAILDTGLAFSMFFGILANICLIYRFLEKRVKTMTIFCILFLTIHDIINIIAVTIFGVEHRFSDGFTYGQGFWMVVCSTSVSTITNVTLLIDLLWTPNFASKGSGLTHKQRSLIISVMTLLCYIAFGALVLTFLLNVTFLDALFFTVVTLETIGFGDIIPKTTASRVATCFYVGFGLVNLALVVGLAREAILESIEVGYHQRFKAAQKARQALLRERRIYRRWRAAVEFRLNQIGEPLWVPDQVHEHSSLGRWLDKIWPWPTGEGRFFKYRDTLGYGDHPHPHGMHMNLEALTWPQLEFAAMEAGVPLRTLLPPGFKPNKSLPQGGLFNTVFARCYPTPTSTACEPPQFYPPDHVNIPLTQARLGRMSVLLTSFAVAVNYSFIPGGAKRNEQPVEFHEKAVRPHLTDDIQAGSVRHLVEVEERRAFYFRLTIVCLMFILFWMVGSGMFTVTEHWSYGISLYFCFISFSTIGYGDLTPKTPAGRSIFVVWALIGVATMTILISIISEAFDSRYRRFSDSKLSSRLIKQYGDQKRERKATRRTKVTTTNASGSRGSEKRPATTDGALEESRRRAHAHLTTLPAELRRRAQLFNESAQFLISPPELVQYLEADIPDGVRQLMGDLAGADQQLEESTKSEILKDHSARKTLLAISIEQALRKMVSAAEDAVEAIMERDRLLELHLADSDATFNPDEVSSFRKQPDTEENDP